jgi:hypothetical protein
MREEIKVVKLDRSKQGLTLTAVVDYRNTIFLQPEQKSER